MTYNVFGGTLSLLNQSIKHAERQLTYLRLGLYVLLTFQTKNTKHLEQKPQLRFIETTC